MLPVDNVCHDFGGVNLRADGARELEKVVTTMREYPMSAIGIRSCTNSRGEATRNLTLLRAEAMATYLRNKGINPKRITTIGSGETQLFINCLDGASAPKPNVSAIGVPISAGWK